MRIVWKSSIFLGCHGCDWSVLETEGAINVLIINYIVNWIWCRRVSMLFFSVSSALSGSIALCPTPQNAAITQEVNTFTQMRNNAYFQNKIPPFV